MFSIPIAGMKNTAKIWVYGLITWIVPFVVAVLFIDQNETYKIDILFFKSIMVVTGALTGAYLLVKYFRDIKTDYIREAINVGITWFGVNLALELIMVKTGIVDMTYMNYLTQIGFTYTTIIIYSLGIGYALEQHKKKKTQ